MVCPTEARHVSVCLPKSGIVPRRLEKSDQEVSPYSPGIFYTMKTVAIPRLLFPDRQRPFGEAISGNRGLAGWRETNTPPFNGSVMTGKRSDCMRMLSTQLAPIAVLNDDKDDSG